MTRKPNLAHGLRESGPRPDSSKTQDAARPALGLVPANGAIGVGRRRLARVEPVAKRRTPKGPCRRGENLPHTTRETPTWRTRHYVSLLLPVHHKMVVARLHFVHGVAGLHA